MNRELKSKFGERERERVEETLRIFVLDKEAKSTVFDSAFCD